MRRRLRLPVLVAGSTCPGTHRDRNNRTMQVPLDQFGDHLCSCTNTGRPQRRALPFERAWAQIFREAGANVQPKPFVRDLGLAGSSDSDNRQLDFLATGTTVHGGLPIACDPTLGSVLDYKGVPHSGGVFKNTRNKKEGTYSDVVASGRVALVVLAALTGGRLSDEAAQVLRALVAQKTEGAPRLLRGSFQQVFSHRWWGILSCAVQRATAALLQECFPPIAGPW